MHFRGRGIFHKRSALCEAILEDPGSAILRGIHQRSSIERCGEKISIDTEYLKEGHDFLICPETHEHLLNDTH